MIYRLDFTRGQPARFEVLSSAQAGEQAELDRKQEQQKQLGWIALVVMGVVLLLRK